MSGVSSMASFKALLSRRKAWMDDDSHYILGLFEKSTHKLVGESMLFNVQREGMSSAEIGLVIYSVFEGRGFGTECLAGTIAWGQSESLSLKRIYGYIRDGNIASMKMCSRCGFDYMSDKPIYRHFDGETNFMWPIEIWPIHE